MLAEGGTSYGHCVTIQRSEHLLGPYETDPESPLITSRDDPFSPFQRSGHGSLVETPKNQWFIAYLCSRPILGTHLSPLGRETALANVKWSEDDWLRLVSGNKKHPSAFLPSPLGIPEYHPTKKPEHDDFTSMTKLPVWYASPRTKADYTFHGALRLFGREVLTSRFTVSLVGRRRTSLYTRATTQCIFTPPSPDVMAGLAYYYDEDNFLAVGKTKTSDDTALQLLVMRQGKGTKETLLTGNTPTITLAVEIRGVIAQFFLIDGTEETPIFAPQDAAMATDETTGGFTGSMITIFCVDVSGNRSFADFSYLEISPSRRKDTSPSKE
jgi:xylan 1,4-beta-xylosidase